MPVDRETFVYYLVRCLTYPFSLLPYRWIHQIGKGLGLIGYYCLRSYRKRSLSNLALAIDLNLSEKELIGYAKESFQNLAINCLEYPKFAKETDFSRVIECENPELADALYKKKQGIIFFCGHQSNWEALFLDGTSRMRGMAIGKPIRNKRLYHWILSIREKNGGKIVAPRNAMLEGCRTLRKGGFIGIVGDQGMPASGYSFPFLGRRAWTSTAPALIAYKTNCPIVFAATRRVTGGYKIRYHDPIWPDLTKPADSEVIRMMDEVLRLLENSIKQSPGEWLWQHNRWKQQTLHNLYKRFRYDCICLILPEEEAQFRHLLPHLATLKQIYPLDFLFLLVPEKFRGVSLIEAHETIYYNKIEEALLKDYRFKLIYNFTDSEIIAPHYEKYSAFETVTLQKLQELAKQHLSHTDDLSEVFKRSLCRPGSIWKKEDTHAC